MDNLSKVYHDFLDRTDVHTHHLKIARSFHLLAVKNKVVLSLRKGWIQTFFRPYWVQLLNCFIVSPLKMLVVLNCRVEEKQWWWNLQVRAITLSKPDKSFNWEAASLARSVGANLSMICHRIWVHERTVLKLLPFTPF